MFALDSEFDNTYLTGYNAATGKVSRTRWQQDLRTRNISNNVEAEGLFHTGAIEHRVLFGMEFANQDRSPSCTPPPRAAPARSPCRRWTCTTGPVAPAPGRDDDQQRRAPQGPHQGYYVKTRSS